MSPGDLFVVTKPLHAGLNPGDVLMLVRHDLKWDSGSISTFLSRLGTVTFYEYGIRGSVQRA